MTTDLLENVEDGIATLTLNRPESYNAFSDSMISGLKEALPRLYRDPEVGTIVLTGAGKAFCAGGDVKGMAKLNEIPPTMEQRASGILSGMEVSKLLHTGPKPTICMLNGVAAGAGFAIAMACDMRVAARNARITTAFAKVGFSGDFGGSYFLTKLVGTAKARELFFTSKMLSADEALALGMVNQVVEEENLIEETWKLATQIANGPRIALEYMKKNLNAAENNATLEQVFEMEAWHMARTGATEDHKEAAKAFVEKRAPVFTGK